MAEVCGEPAGAETNERDGRLATPQGTKRGHRLDLNPNLMQSRCSTASSRRESRSTRRRRARRLSCNVLRNPTITVLVAVGMEYAQLRGVQAVGRATVFDDMALTRTLPAEMNRRYGWNRGPDDLDQARKLRNRVAIAIDVDRLVSWDHRRLAR
jgi:hypothetical protein